MSNELNQGTKIVFADGVERVVNPLTIKQLRKFMKVVKDMDSSKVVLEDSDIDLMIDAAAIVFEKLDPTIAADRDALEDVIDLKSFNAMFMAAMGTDPNV